MTHRTAGHLSIVELWSGEPVCIIETSSIAVLPFDAVTREFAAVEGEGDGSLEYWHDGHWAYFGRGCARIGRQQAPVCRSCASVSRSYSALPFLLPDSSMERATYSRLRPRATTVHVAR